jgi:hypothetical protein
VKRYYLDIVGEDHDNDTEQELSVMGDMAEALLERFTDWTTSEGNDVEPVALMVIKLAELNARVLVETIKILAGRYER